MKACITATITLASAALLLSACSIDGPDPAPEQTTSWGPVHHESAPLEKHFPELGTPTSASWAKGSGGGASSRVDLPSPSSTVVSAIIKVDPGVARDLRSTLSRSGKMQLEDGTWADDPDADDTPPIPVTPDLAPALRPLAPGGPFVSGTSSLGSAYGWNCAVYVHRDKPIVILRATLPWATSFE